MLDGNDPTNCAVIDSSYLVDFLMTDPDRSFGLLSQQWELRGATIHGPDLIGYETTDALWPGLNC